MTHPRQSPSTMNETASDHFLQHSCTTPTKLPPHTPRTIHDMKNFLRYLILPPPQSSPLIQYDPKTPPDRKLLLLQTHVDVW